MPLSCADLFCGAGGFSEGFRQAGFRVTTAVDLWRPAALTHQKEHPDTEVLR
ncbi:MAG: DNA cytosine methyltransferase, partial [Chloroflexota bacterium]